MSETMHDESDARSKRHKTIGVAIGAVVALAIVVVAFKAALSAASCSWLEKEVATVAASAIAPGLTADTIVAAREAAAAKAQSADLGPVTVEAAIERRTNVQLQTSAHVVIEVHAGDCHAEFERPLDASLTSDDLAWLAEHGVQERTRAPKGHHH